MPELKNVIVDSSCLIVLDKISKLNLLQQLYAKVFVTPQVIKEVGNLPSWIETFQVKNTNYLRILHEIVGLGEASSIALAVENLDCTLILDDKKARSLAKNLSLKVTGTLAVLIQSKKKGFINSVEVIINQLQEIGFYMSEKTKKKVLLLANEEI